MAISGESFPRPRPRSATSRSRSPIRSSTRSRIRRRDRASPVGAGRSSARRRSIRCPTTRAAGERFRSAASPVGVRASAASCSRCRRSTVRPARRRCSFPPGPVRSFVSDGTGRHSGRHDDDDSAAQSITAESVRVRKPRPPVRGFTNLRRGERALVGASRHRRHRVDVRGERRGRAARQLVRRAHRRHEGLERGRRPRRPNGRGFAAAQLVRDDARRHVDRSGLGPEPADVHQRARASTTTSTRRTPGDFTSAIRSRSPTPDCASARSRRRTWRRIQNCPITKSRRSR